MKRDWELVRKMLIYTETERALPESVDGIDQPIVDYHRKILGQSELINYDGLTTEGRDLLGRIKCDTAWDRIKRFSAERDIALTTDSIKLMSIC